MAVMSQREGLEFSFPLDSDCAPLNGLVAGMLKADGPIHCLRDPTRGGLATTLNEIASQSRVEIEIDEERIPVSEGVRAACEMLGLDPLYVANEGKLVAFVAPEAERPVLEAMRRQRYGKDAAVIGRVTSAHPGRVVMKTLFGAHRILDMLSGAQLPRIC
jgi:hydrogenase expression/formation protein HypE